jgi:hypothetical protein
MGQGLTAEPQVEIINSVWHYVQSCRVDDGGYFFARISPGSLLDSCYAVKTLSLVGSSPEHPEALKAFVLSHVEKSSKHDTHAQYLASEILKELGDAEGLSEMAAGLIPSKDLGLITRDSLYIEVASELQPVFEYIFLLRNLDLKFDEGEIVSLIRSMQNDDGGYGSGHSSLATTYYAVKTLSLIGALAENVPLTLKLLKRREKDVYFLEDVFYLVSTRAVLGVSDSNPDAKISFVLDCRRKGGGFARARLMGIPTLEYTYYAMSILKHLGFLKNGEGGEG